MKTPFLLVIIAALVIAAPAVSSADPRGHGGYYGSSRYGGYYGHYRGYYGSGYPYGYPCGYWGPGPVIAFNFGGSRPVYQGRVVDSDASLEANVQRALKRKGYYSGAVDGDIGPRSRSAIRDYQADHNLPVTGRVDEPLLHALGL